MNKKLHQKTEEVIIELAKFLHEEYENSARLFGWESQEKCRVPFDDLPEANKKTMLSVAQKLNSYWLKKIEEIPKELDCLSLPSERNAYKHLLSQIKKILLK